LEGTDLLGATNWWWCAGLEKNCSGRPGVAGTTCCCCGGGGGSVRRLCAEAVEEDDDEVEEASWWPLLPWPLPLLLLAMVAMVDDLTTSEVSFWFRQQSGSLNVGPNTSPPPLLPAPAAVAAPTPWNDFCNRSMEQ
jgi:hypothetical protein